MTSQHVAVLIPCFNEQGAIGQTIDEFRIALPDAQIIVYDNNSNDETVTEAKQHGALVFHEPRQGKGEVVRRMLADIEADIYIMIDGDNTYDATIAPTLVNTLVTEKLDMVIGTRSYVESSFPQGHILGNRVFSSLINTFFNAELTDVFTGYRVMSRRFVKSMPLVSLGFEIETEITVHALQTRVALKEIPTEYRARPEGTTSKLRTFSDGFKILGFIFFLLRDVKPLLFFSLLSFVSVVISLSLGIPVILEFLEIGLVPRFPTAILASAFALIAVICLVVGIVLDNVSRGRLEAKQLRYLNVSKPS
ncbi:glycosyltransferase family 2 protein [Vibrio mediterranei]|jgi:glycosyltransferase involved in cell wall biosynthesis|uniref:Glycosyltransferase family 2 protein n=1 Tax=Vibrio barjaei TaxID=1676683 RepID=A0ABW7IHG3_9VIBR|nr:glycosyltransferase family 2 protein [Vibrio barjaei]MCG9787138.1 glycosyltransferase family 2 protein [Vibrio mediterranei]OIN25703.1 glycosyltransferase [Vibrio barjaei]